MSWNSRKKKIRLYFLWGIFLLALNLEEPAEIIYYGKLDSYWDSTMDLAYEIIGFDGRRAQVFGLDLSTGKDSLGPGTYLRLRTRGRSLKSWEEISNKDLPLDIKRILDGRIR